MDGLAGLIEASHERWVPHVVAATLGTDEPAAVAEAICAAVADAVGVAVAAPRFYEPGVGIVAGLELADGRAVVAKVHRGTLVTELRLTALTRLQADLAASGAPVPASLAGPVALGNGWLTVEELLPGRPADGYDPAVRRGMAVALHRFVEGARGHAGEPWIGGWLGEPEIDDLWPEPHDLRFDFPATAAGAEWIDEVARVARAALTGTSLHEVVGHLDWRVQNLGFTGTEVTAVYDWDSVGLVPEAALVGSASVIHPADFRLELRDPMPTLEQVDGFVADYEAARGTPFDEQERAVLEAGQRWVTAFGARCQHSDHQLGLFPQADVSTGWPRLLGQLLTRRSTA